MKVVSKPFYVKRLLFVTSWLSALIVIAGWVTGCENFSFVKKGHIITTSPEGHTIVCQSCYDEVVSVKNDPYFLQELDGVNYKTIKKHICSDCKMTMNFYAVNGELMVKCKRCAPESVPCDRCLPPPLQGNQGNNDPVNQQFKEILEGHYPNPPSW